MSDVTDEQLADIEADVDLILADSNGAPYLRLAASFPLLVRALRDARDGSGRLERALAQQVRVADSVIAERETLRERLAAVESEAERLRHLPYLNGRSWVEGSIHDAVKADRDALRAENERLRTCAERLQADTYRLRLQLSAALPTDAEHPERACGCRRCDDAYRDTLPWLERIGRPMVVCPECGSKRCPRAEWHGNDCPEAALAAPTQEASEHE